MSLKQRQKQSQQITLRGSTEIVTEFFGYAVNSVLYQRGLYPANEFEVKKKFGLGMLVSSNEEVKKYLVSVLDQINEWLIKKTLEKLVLVISNVRTRETVERWVFDIELDRDMIESEKQTDDDECDENQNPKTDERLMEEQRRGEKKYEKSEQEISQ